MGWNNTWTPGMVVGKVYTVNNILSSSGIGLGVFNYPFFVLKIIKKKPVVEVTMKEVCSKFGFKVKIKKD